AYNEVQLDCDWTEKTKDNYFLFLTEIRKQIENKKVLLSATIRLHQVKYKEVTGVPPVNRGMLMFYNMGDVGNPNEKNSIFNKEKANLYVNYLNAYLLPLDVALPIFRWQAHFRDGRILNLFSKKNLNDLKETHFKEVGTNKFVATRDKVAAGKYIREGDLLKVEEIKKEDLINAAKLLKQNLSNENRRLVFYDLDDYNLKCYEKTIYQTITDCLN
ncbi:MAG: hypothetical protein IT236_00060, partial [Bacteroidia bacterium]|nr:hypothetical protein [Bacteroidia bacterium]